MSQLGAIIMAVIAMSAVLNAQAQETRKVPYTPIPHPITMKILREIGKTEDIGQVEQLLDAKAPADVFNVTEGKCSEYKFMYGTKLTADHVTIQQCENGYFYVNGISHESYSLTENNRGLFDCHLLFGGRATAANGYDACPKN
jgi:hypothetical protein